MAATVVPKKKIRETGRFSLLFFNNLLQKKYQPEQHKYGTDPVIDYV